MSGTVAGKKNYLFPSLNSFFWYIITAAVIFLFIPSSFSIIVKEKKCLRLVFQAFKSLL